MERDIRYLIFEDGEEHTPKNHQSAELDKLEARVLKIYEGGMQKLQTLTPDFYKFLRSIEPVRFTLDLKVIPLAGCEYSLNYVILNVITFGILSEEEAEFMLAHEAQHLLDGFDYEPREKEDPRLHQRAGNARDIVVNDRLVKRGLPVPKAPATIRTGPKLIGKDCSELNWREIVDLLPEDIPSDPTYYLRRVEAEKLALGSTRGIR